MVARRVLEGDLARLAGLLARAAREDVHAARQQVAALRRALSARPRDEEAAEQLALALRLASDAPIRDCPLGCPVPAVVCVARQLQSEMERKGVRQRTTSRACRRRADPDRARELARHDGKRGTQASRPTCVTEHCQVGAIVRALHGDTDEAWTMAEKAPRETDTSN